jgi:aminopeptidase YwaD
MEQLRERELPYSLDVVPFNGEEHYEVSRQRAYLSHRSVSSQATRLMINVDGLGHQEAESAFSFYNLDSARTACATELIDTRSRMTMGEEWIAGDHAIFAFQGIPCIAVTSSNLMERVICITHIDRDTVDEVDARLLENTATTIADLITTLPLGV